MALSLLVFIGVMGFFQLIPNGVAIAVALLAVIYEFQKRLDQGVPLLQLTSMIAVLQWLVGPVLNYSSDMDYGRYSMYVSEEIYFSFAIPATTFFVAIMLSAGASVKQQNLLSHVQRGNFIAIGILLNVIAIVADFAATRAGGGLQFFLFLISQLRYIGALYFIFSRGQFRLLLAFASCFSLFSMSLAVGMFHDLILWMSILFCYWFAQRRWSTPVKLLTLTVSATVLFSIQVVKQEYRQKLKDQQNPSFLGLTVDYLSLGGKGWETSSLQMVITRLNQGWIISAVMANVPENEPYADGETIKEAVLVSIAPRFLWADKKIAGGRQNFMRFTGLQIGLGTAMAISPLGEAYANFGVIGGIGFMIVFGAFFSLFYYGALRYALKHPTFLFWIPLIFYQAMKAETELSVVLNQLTKGAVVAFGGFYLLRQVLPVKLKSIVPATSAAPELLSLPPSTMARLGSTPGPK